LRHRASPSSPRRVRNFLLYLTAIKEYETATATALFWEKQSEEEKKIGLVWKERYEACRSECQDLGIPKKLTAQAPELADGSG